ncbi:hypothetical protein [Rhodobacter maris]|uniref:Uncharacterized protein n=1 Tax=Rhodobacter maris TaxID=446682 RepID=A0A285TM43_9RHOB|nr:hypothetical protein [Rhodobacter maris]SOC23592.1 hypothetical protein SAMN05877831_1423 [Rhodobacter maris]
MSQSATINATPGVWTQLTSKPVTNIRVNNQSGFWVHLKATPDETAPTDMQGSQLLPGFLAIAANISLEDIFPQFPQAVHVWAYNPQDTSVLLSVCHA